MEKEKILQQLEEKLLPSVQNLERNQATDHDFFPALLWLILEKSKDSESLLKDISSKYSEELKNISELIVENNKIYHEKSIILFENKILSINQKIEDLKSTPLKIEKKFPIGILVLSIFQLITLAVATVMLMKQA